MKERKIKGLGQKSPLNRVFLMAKGGTRGLKMALNRGEGHGQIINLGYN